ncbi:MAG: hypothetical protein M1449_05790 [Candidatus Thermoplasmatota archaeon]|nr:hypothetical protein [Candidatus Thermoplasmatota archaeon]
MQANLEVLEGLVRRLDISVPMDQLENEVQSRLKRLARNVKMDGFRPGKAPLSAVARQHGAGVRQEVLGETLQTRFGEAVQAHQLKIAGYPRFEPKAGQAAAMEMTFSASFEVYPEVKIDDLSNGKISRPVVNVGDAEVSLWRGGAGSPVEDCGLSALRTESRAGRCHGNDVQRQLRGLS